MHQVLRSLALIFITLATGCYGVQRQMPMDDGDSNGDGVHDAEQSIGTGYDADSGEPYLIFFNGPHLPPFQANLQWIGFGCSTYDGDASDDWQRPCAPLVPYLVNGEQRGFVLTNVREGVPFEGVPVDASTFLPNGGGWTEVAMGQTAYDDPDFIVRHVNWSDCPLEAQRTATHYGFMRLGDHIIGLGESIAPPDQDCGNSP